MGTFQTALTFKKGVLTNGSQLPGEDYISGLLFYGTAPALFPVSGVKQCFSPQDAINVGVTATHDDETKATATYLVTAGAAGAGDTIAIYVQEPINPTNTAANPNKVLVCLYTTVAGDTVINTLAANINTAINANIAASGGYTSTVSTATVSLKARPGLGIALNTGTPMSVVITGSITGTITQFTGGVASKLDVYNYHISEYFVANPTSVLFIGIFAVPSAYNFVEVQTMQAFANGSIRQIGVYAETRSMVTNFITDANSLNTICTTLDRTKMPLSSFLVEDMAAVTDLTTLPNLSLLNDSWVSDNISQDGAGLGWALFKAYGKTISNLGALLGVTSINSVSADFAQPIPVNNISNGFENALPALGNGTIMNLSNVSEGLQTQLDNYRHIYSGSYVGYTGTYFSDSHCAIISNSNYAYVEQNRVFAKIERIMYAAYLPYLKSELSLNNDGTLVNTLVIALQSVGNNALASMVQNKELSAVKTIINPLQNVLTSGKLIVTLYEINNPIARNIEIDINSVTSIPS